MHWEARFRTATRCTLALAVAVLAVLLRWLMVPVFGTGTLYLLLFPAVLIISVYVGPGPAVLASVIGCFLTDYLLVEPVHSLAMHPTELAQMSIVVFSAALVGLSSGRLRSAQARALDQATGREKAEAESRRSREQFRVAADAAGIGVWEHDLLTDQLTWDDKHSELFGMPTSTERSFDAFVAAIHRDDRERVCEAVERTIRDGADFAQEYRVVHADGQVHWILDRGSVQRDGKGTPLRVSGVVMDITSAKVAEEAILASRERLEWVLETTGIGLWFNRLPLERLVWDKRTRELFFIPPDAEPTIELFWSRVHPDDREPTRLAVEKALRDRTLYSIDHRAVNPETGEIRWVRSAGRARYAADGTPNFFDGINYDVTERKRAESVFRSSAERFELLARSAEQLLQSREPQKAVDSLCQAVMEHLGCDTFFNFLVDPVAGKLRLNACAGIPAEEAQRIEWLDYGVAVCGCAARDGSRIVAEHINERPDPRTDLVRSYGVRAYACHPLLGPGGGVLGTLSFGTRTRDRFSDDDLSLMKVVADQVAVAITRMRGEEALQESEKRHRRSAEDLAAERSKLRAVIENLPVGVGTGDLNGAMRSLNKAGLEIHGFACEQEMLAALDDYARRFELQYLDGRIMPVEEWPVSKAVRGEFVRNCEVRLCNLSDGSQRIVSYSVTPVRNSQGEPVMIVYVLQDLTEEKQAQEELRESQERFRVAQDLSLDAFTILSAVRGENGGIVDFRWEYANPAAAALLKHTPEELMGSGLLELLPGNRERSELFNRYVRVVETGEPHDIEMAYTADGITGFFRNMCVKLGDGVAVYFTDITQRKRDEEALRESESRFRTMADGLPLIVWVHGLDGTQQFANRTYCEFFGVTEEQMRGGRWQSLVHPDDAVSYTAEFRACVAERRLFHAEVRVRRADGQWRWVESWARPQVSSSGEYLGFVGASADVTNRKEAEAALRESQERVRLAVAAGHMGTWDWEVNTDRVQWSEGTYAVLGYKAGDVQPSYQAFCNQIHPDDLPRRKRELDEAMETRREYLCEYRVTWPDGSAHWVEARGRFVYDESGRPVRMYGVVLDVDERKQLDQQRLGLLEAERAARMESERLVRLKDEFLATVSHELRSPLSAIAGWSGLLAKGKADPDKALGIIQRSTSSLAQIVEDLLDMSRIISGKIRLSPGTVNLPELVNNAVDGVQFTAIAKSIDIQVSFAPDLTPIECDPNRVQQIIWNLLTNAIKFTPEGGHVELALTQTHRSVSILVKDTGKGIAREFLPYLFDRFRQEDGGIARKHGGLGLGLSIVKHLVELHGGTVEAHSEGEGRGALFIVTLPRVGAVSPQDFLRLSFQQAAEPNSVNLDECTLAGVKVLAVDDDPFSRELLARTLSDTGAIVRTVETVPQAIAVLAEFRPDVLISDIGMPDQDGYSFIRKLKGLTNDWRAKLPAIAVTAFSRPEDRERALLAGFDEHMSKPFDPGVLCVTIRKLVPQQCPVEDGTIKCVHGVSEKAVSAPRSAVEPGPVKRRRHILLAEDNLTISEMIKAALEEHGYEVSVADTIEEGVAIANRCRVDILLSDLRLKDGHGWDLLTRLHSVRVMPAIVMSGYADNSYIRKSKAAGFSEYLVKPVDPDELVKVIGSLLAEG